MLRFQRNLSLGILDIFRRAVPNETNQFALKPFLGGHSKALKHAEIIIAASTDQHKGCNDAQAPLLNECNRNCCCSAISLVAVAPLQATTVSSINPTDMMTNYKGPLPVEQWDAI